MLVDLLFCAGQVASIAGLACGAYITLHHGREESLRKAVENVRFAEFDFPNHVSVVPA